MIHHSSNVCFVTPPSQGKSVVRDYAGGLGFEADSGYILPPLDNLQMAACIQDTFNVSLIDAQAAGLSVEQLCEKLVNENVNLVICELSVPTLDSDIACAITIAQHGIIVVVKIHTKETSILTKILASGSIRLCLIDECEDILSDILLGHDMRGTAQLSDGEVCIVDKAFIDDLDALPFPRRDLSLNYRYSYPKLGECTTLLSSRGCPFACRYYCPYPMTQGRKWRFRSSESVVRELAEIRQLGIKRVLFRDPVFSMESDRVIEMCVAMMDQKIDLEWWCETRADLLPDDLIDLMAKAGCKGINVGVESGDPALRFSKLKRGVSDDVLKGVADKTAEAGIKLAFLLMVGFPGENRNSVLATAALLQRCRPYSIGIGFPVHHPGTQLEKDAIEKGWIVQSDYQLTDGSLPVLAGPGLSPTEMVKGRDLLVRLFDAISANNAEAEHLLMNNIQTWSQGAP
jgi:radical SAM superfamily enzyme YgiQ (UPF0313 family)